MKKLDLKSGYPANGRFIFEFEDEASARSFFNCTPKDALIVLERWNCSAAVARVAGQSDIILPLATVRLMASSEPLLRSPIAQLFFADVSLPAAILKQAADLINSEDRWGIVRLTDERQVIMSGGMSGVLLSGVDLEQTTNWRRPEFWHPGDLDEFNRDWQRQLEVENGQSIERRYRIHKPQTADPWEWYNSSYRLIQGEDGLQYHLGIFVGRG